MTRAATFLLAVALAVTAAPAWALHPGHQPTATDGAAGSVVWGCPMDETVRSSQPGTCPRCGMALVPMGPAAVPAGPASLPLMPGLPPWLFFTMAVSVLAVSFVVLEWRDRPPRAGPRVDLMRLPGLRRVLRAGWFPAVVQLPVVLLFLLAVGAGLFGNPAPGRNIAPVLTWTVWWASLVFLVLCFGTLWCTVCPWMALADWLARLLPRRERPWPRALRNVWPATALFVGLTWLELGYGVTEKPWLTAGLGLVMLGLSLGTLVLFERKGFCRWACLVGRVTGLYATVAAMELRPADRDVCRHCRTKDCYRGNDAGPPCPTHEFLGGMRANTNCTLCLACVKTCPHDNVAWNLRPVGADLLESMRPRHDEAWLAVVLLALTAFHGLSMTPTWDAAVAAIDAATGVGRLAAFSLAMAVMLVVPVAAYYGVCVVMAACARDRRHPPSTLFVRFATSLLPIALSYHLAHNLQHVLFEGTKLAKLASDPFGWGWDVFGTATWPVQTLLPLAVGWGLQVALVLGGHVYAIVVAHRTARTLYPNARAATASQLPMLAAMMGFSFQSLWLLSQPMLMRTAL